MLTLLPILALAAPFDDLPRMCEIHRPGTRGEFAAYHQFPDEGVPNPVRHGWTARVGKANFWMEWHAPGLGPPPDLAVVSIVFRDLPKGVDHARLELWRDGKLIPQAVGGWTNLVSMGHRELNLSIGWKTLRTAAGGGPVTLTAVDEDGDRFAQQTLDPVLFDEPIALAESARSDFAAMTAHWQSCPFYQEPEIVVT